MRIKLILWLLSSILVACSTALAQTSNDPKPFPLLINFNDLNVGSIAMAYSTQLLDVRPRSEYDAEHVPNSIWVDLKQAEQIAARPGGLTDRDAWIDWITPLGLKSFSNVRIIGSGKQLEAARIWWLLRYLGVERVGLVNGNLALWKAQRRPVSAEVTETQPFSYPVDFQTDRLATRDDLLATIKTGDRRVIDARSLNEWVGKDVRAKRGGHIPAACRVEWSTLVDNDGRFLPIDQLRAKVAASGVKPGEAVTIHCQTGGRASVDAFVFELLGYPTRNFYLGWSDWGNADDTPITTDETPAPAPAPATAPAADAPAGKPFTVEYDYKCHWGQADEFLTLFRRNHLPILRERQKLGDILQITMIKPRIHTGEADRWDYRVTLVFKDAAAAFNIAADEPIKQRLFPDQASYKVEEQRRFAILEGHTDLPIEEVDLAKPVTAP